MKRVITSFVVAFFITTLLLESLVCLPSLWMPWEKKHGLGDSFTRFRTEGTAVELYAEDIWRNGRRTLKTPFDPSACTTKYLNKWVVRWSEIECTADDEMGHHWQYTTRHSDNFTVLFFIPFLMNMGPTRVLKISPPDAIRQEITK